MYTAYIGRKLIHAVNQRETRQYTPKTFFDTVFYPCFFGNERFLLDTNNAPPGQAYKQKGKTPLTPAVIEEQRRKIHLKIDGGDIDASIFLGGPSSDAGATTSGQVTDLARRIPADDVYASWIGTGLAATVEGGLSLLIDDDEALLALYEGWDRYRKYLDQTPVLKPHQINTWNGQWLAYRFSESYHADVRPTWDTSSDRSALNTNAWVSLLFALSYHYRKSPGKLLTVYAFAFGQMNRTLGFIRFDLPEAEELHELYNGLLPALGTGDLPGDFLPLYKTEFGFKRACESVTVGKRALQPKDLRAYLEGKQPTFDAGDAEKRFYFQLQERWIVAMLNNSELEQRAEQLAGALKASIQTDRGKTVKANKVSDVLVSKTRREFVDKLTEVLEQNSENGELFNDVVKDVITMPAENVPLFLTLLRFKYAYLSPKSSSKSATDKTESDPE
jgi:hypothetical protein